MMMMMMMMMMMIPVLAIESVPGSLDSLGQAGSLNSSGIEPSPVLVITPFPVMIVMLMMLMMIVVMMIMMINDHSSDDDDDQCSKRW